MSMTTVIVVICLLIALALIVIFLIFGRGESRFTFDIGGAAPRATGGAGNSPDTGFRERLAGLGIFSGTVIAALWVKLWSMQLLSTNTYSQQAESNRTRTISTPAPRGRILDRNGNELVTNRSSLTVTASSVVADDQLECQLLGNLIGMPWHAVRRKIQDTSDGAQSMRTVASDVSRHTVAYIEERPYLFHDVTVEQRTVRLYPHGSLAAHVVGYTGTISADQLKNAKDKRTGGNADYQSGDTVGQAGVEYQYENVLQGIRGEKTVYVNADGKVLDHVSTIDPQPGSDVMLTLDSGLQEAAEEALQKIIKKLSKPENEDRIAGCVICMDVTNGEILAMASEPTFSPNIFVGGISASDWEELGKEESDNPLLNRAVTGQYPSASTIKPLSALAALDNQLATQSSTYNCTGYWTGFGKDYGQYCWNHDGHGIMSIETGIVFSCDVVFYEIGKAVFYSKTPEALQDKYRSWGLGKKTGIDLPSESVGRVPDAKWKWNYFSSADDTARSWQGGDNTNLAIGQGDLLVTPLQMTCVYAGLANGGYWFTPHVLKSVMSREGSGSVIDYKAKDPKKVKESDTNFDLIHRALKGVVYDESEAQASHFTNMTVRVAGKTGTAESGHDQPHGWFISYVPADKPKYVVASCLEYAGFGSASALYVVRDVLGAIYGQPDTSEQEVEGDR